MLRNNFLNLHDVILLFTIVEIPLLCVLLKLMSSLREQSKNIFIFFFLLVAGTLATTLITWNSYLQTLEIGRWDIIPLILSCCLLLQGPALYYYLKSLSEEILFLRWINLVHLIPSFIVCVVIFAFDINVADWLPHHWAALSTGDRAAVKFVNAIVKCVPLIYVFACALAVSNLRQHLKLVSSSISPSDLLWAYIVLGGFFIHWCWSFIMYFLSDYVGDDLNDILGIANNYFTVALVNTLFAFGVFDTRRQLLYLTTLQESQKIEVPRADEKMAAVEKGIHVKKLYLESQINLERFAEQIGLRPREVSAVLSSQYQSNFFEFINGFRVEEAKRLLLAPDAQQLSIQEIIYKSGFNSQSAFHRFFKRIVGLTPSEYRSRTLSELAAAGAAKT